MRGSDGDAMTPEIAGALMAVDATLAGDAVDPEYAELAELALILRRESPRTSDAFAASLDERVERRFARPAPAARGAGLRRRLLAPAAGLAAAVAGVVVVLVVGGLGGLGGLGGSGALNGVSSSSSAASGSATVAASTSASAGSGSAGGGSGGGSSAGTGAPAGASAGRVTPDAKALSSHEKSAPHGVALSSSGSSGSGGSAGSSGAARSSAASSAASTPAAGTPVPSPVAGGNRQVVQSAQLALSAPASRIDDVAQEVFDVVGQEKGYVNNSNVTSSGGPGSSAYFQLSVPSSNLEATLTQLSRLRGAHVVSRTDQTSDITAAVGGAGQKLAQARALRHSLLKQLASATTSEQVTSIQAQLHDANASIASDLSKLRGLQRQVAYSTIQVSLDSASVPVPVRHPASGFTIGKAAHDAGRVLVVVAGVALIVLAVMVPVGLVGALVAWVGLAVRRRRREQALDLV